MSNNEKQPMAPTTENIIEAYNVAKETGADSTCKVLEALYPNIDFNPKDNRPAMERIKTFEDALAALGEDNALVKHWRWIAGCEVDDELADGTPGEFSDVKAYLKLRIITAALNEGWKPQFVRGEYRWYPYFELFTQEEIDEMDDEEKSRVVYRSSNSANAHGGVACANTGYNSALVYASIGSRLAFKTEELARYAGQQFIEIYANFCFIPGKPKSLS